MPIIFNLNLFLNGKDATKSRKRESKVSPNTVVDWVNYCREVCVVMMEEDDNLVGRVE